MTWYFDPSGKTYDAYDPSGTQFITGREFSGSWSNTPPDDFYSVASQHIQNAPDIDTALGWVGELIADDTMVGTPPT